MKGLGVKRPQKWANAPTPALNWDPSLNNVGARLTLIVVLRGDSDACKSLLRHRYTNPPPGRPRSSSDCVGLDLESTFDLGGFSARGIVPAEVTRYCVLRRYRSTGVTWAPYLALRGESRRRGITHWLAAASMETDFPEDAALAYDLVCTRRLVDERFHADARVVAPAHTPRRRSCYTEEQRRSGLRGELGSLAMPRTLALFATRMGARFIGPPAYDSYFNVFSLPLVAVLRAEGAPQAAA